LQRLSVLVIEPDNLIVPKLFAQMVLSPPVSFTHQASHFIFVVDPLLDLRVARLTQHLTPHFLHTAVMTDRSTECGFGGHDLLPSSENVVGEPALRLGRDFTIALEHNRPRRHGGPGSATLVIPLPVSIPGGVIAAVTAPGPAVDHTQREFTRVHDLLNRRRKGRDLLAHSQAHFFLRARTVERPAGKVLPR